MKKILFVIHDLHHGGAEKVLVNLVNHMDKSRFAVSILALFGGGVNEQFLSPDVRLLHGHSRMIPGNSHIMKLFSPRQLFRHYIREKYDVIVSYLEGPSARIVSGCPEDGTRLVSWVHCTIKTEQELAIGFRNAEEARRCYQRFDRSIFVSEGVQNAFCAFVDVSAPQVLYNTMDSAWILKQAEAQLPSMVFLPQEIKLLGIGKLMPVKGFDRLVRIHKRLRMEDNLPVHTYLLGEGAEQGNLEGQIAAEGLAGSVTLLGYQKNPYQYLRKADLFVCASHAEGFSTAATEALIVGTPVISTRVSGMEEMLGAHNEYGVITDNDEEALYQGLKAMLTKSGMLEHYRKMGVQRGAFFNTERTVADVEKMLDAL